MENFEQNQQNNPPSSNQPFETILTSTPKTLKPEEEKPAVFLADNNLKDKGFNNLIRTIIIFALIAVSVFEAFQLYKLNEDVKGNINQVIPNRNLNIQNTNTNQAQPQAGCQG